MANNPLVLGNLKKVCYTLVDSGRGTWSWKGGTARVKAVDIFPRELLSRAGSVGLRRLFVNLKKLSGYATGGEISLTFSQDRTKKV